MNNMNVIIADDHPIVLFGIRKSLEQIEWVNGFLVTEIAKKLNRSIKTISSQKKSAMMKLGVENDIALLNYLSSVTLSPADKD
ncbi:LuxR C-terminal-related transcriptional regulator [Escherichia coli]